MTMILGNEYLRRRLGRHIHRKPSHFGLWLDEGNDNHDDNPCSHDNHNDNHNDNHCSNNNSYYSHGSQVQLNLTDTNQVDINQVNTKPKQRKPTTAIATFKVEGELGSAKIIFQVELPDAGEKRLTLLLAEFSNSDKYIIYELNEKPQLPAM